jgi:hypothetical protein
LTAGWKAVEQSIDDGYFFRKGENQAAAWDDGASILAKIRALRASGVLAPIAIWRAAELTREYLEAMENKK